MCSGRILFSAIHPKFVTTVRNLVKGYKHLKFDCLKPQKISAICYKLLYGDSWDSSLFQAPRQSGPLNWESLNTKVKHQLFACLFLLRFPHYLRAWNRLLGLIRWKLAKPNDFVGLFCMVMLCLFKNCLWISFWLQMILHPWLRYFLQILRKVKKRILFTTILIFFAQIWSLCPTEYVLFCILRHFYVSRMWNMGY